MPTRRQLANALRFLSIDAVQKANSGHPGMPMGMADIAEVLWNDFLRHNPSNPAWPNRDRFILSNGHGSMLQYSLLHLTGYDLSLDDIKQFRQLYSKTPGHPEVDDTPGIETTTGPLGQGLANGVGMAIAEKILAAQFNRDDFNLIDHYTYIFAGDGCLMEGLSHEVCSLAGTLGLGKLIVFWDNNHISIDGDTEGWFTDNTPERFKAYHWHVIEDIDGHNGESIKKAIQEAQAEKNKPTLICCRTTIGYGSPHKAGTAASHGSPLGEEEIALVREQLDWPYDSFQIPEEIYSAFNAQEKGEALEENWKHQFDEYKKQYYESATELERRLANKLPTQWKELTEKMLEKFINTPEKTATRKASLKVLDIIGPELPELLGGSADLSGSNLTRWAGCKALTAQEADANYIYYGVREFGMSAIMNGIALYNGFIPYGGTFLVFYSYAASAVRMAALMKQRSIFVYTHDSIGLGEDGPTHQPIEQLASLRSTPNVSVWRPCDEVETAIAWQMAIENTTGPTALALSRQGLPPQEHAISQVHDIKRGGYVLFDCEDTPDGIIIATGSEVSLAIEAAKILNTEHHKKIRVVSMPSTDAFIKQDKNYRETVLPSNVKIRIAIEAGATSYWRQFVGDEGQIVGLDRFGLSAPMQEIYTELKITVAHLVSLLK